MKFKIVFLAALALVVGLGTAISIAGEPMPMGTSFTYQGRLDQDDEPTDGQYDFRFMLYDSNDYGDPCQVADDPCQIGDTVYVHAIDVEEGLFTVELDFGPDGFTGEKRWLDIAVRSQAAAIKEYTPLTPWQEVTPAPYSLYARNGLNPATNDGDLATWDGNNWVARPPAVQRFSIQVNNMQPYQAVTFVIALQGIYPSRNGADPFIGEIMMGGWNFNPRGWAFCNGQLLAISQYEALFSLLGTNYGGDGRTTFGLPELRGRVPIHFGHGPGLTNRRLGEKGGSQTTTVTR